VRAFSVETLPLGNLSHDNGRQLEDYLRGATVVAWFCSSWRPHAKSSNTRVCKNSL